MKIKKCQIDVRTPCADRGYVCLKSYEDKRRFNEMIKKAQAELEKAKFELDGNKNSEGGE